ncbi:MAG TPA: DeoR/GlpR transcriptional regulator, partial [Firmicutes bacterium]|nr:DeoR/GlpR transcriptional regulator [Bacillota bacterium]
MLAVERRALILSELKEHQTIRVADLSKKCGVTEETIRRDLERLEQSNLLVRTHGGAIAIQSGAEMSFDFRNQQNVREKQQIARKAASTLSRGDTIFLDASTTSLYLAQEISNKTDLTVITNSARIVFELSNKPHITVISTGGILRSTSLSFVGPLTNEA